MHAPDGFLNAGTAVATGAISATTVGASLRLSRDKLRDHQIPLAGVSAAFIFAAQMVNFPVAAGTTGHLLGGALAAILLGPATGAVVVTVVVIAQALLFADGGLTALGYNVLNMAIVPAFGGYAIFRLLLRPFRPTLAGVAGAAGIAAGLSVVLSAMAFSIEWLFGATAPVSFPTVFGAMVGVHLLIGIGEGLISGLAVASVLAVRPDLVAGVADQDIDRSSATPLRDNRVLLVAGLAVAFVVAAVVSQFAAGDPDGLERVAIDQGFANEAEEHALADSLFADYATEGIRDEEVSLAVAGVAGTAIVFVVGLGLAMALRERPPGPRGGDRPPAAA